MRFYLFLSFALFTLLRCTEKPVPPQSVQQKVTTEFFPLDKDTVNQNHDLEMYNKPYQLEITRYCLNDSLVERKLEGNEPKILSIAHNYVSKIKLNQGTVSVLYMEINKETFKDSLDTDFYKIAVLHHVAYDGVRSNRLFFKASVTVPDTDWMCEFRFGIFYQTEKKGQLDYWGKKCPE